METSCTDLYCLSQSQVLAEQGLSIRLVNKLPATTSSLGMLSRDAHTAICLPVRGQRAKLDRAWDGAGVGNTSKGR